MTMLVSLALLILGITLLVFGFNSADSISSHLSKFFSGHPTDKAIWLIVGGIVCTAAGLGGVVRTSRVSA